MSEPTQRKRCSNPLPVFAHNLIGGPWGWVCITFFLVITICCLLLFFDWSFGAMIESDWKAGEIYRGTAVGMILFLLGGIAVIICRKHRMQIEAVRNPLGKIVLSSIGGVIVPMLVIGSITLLIGVPGSCGVCLVNNSSSTEAESSIAESYHDSFKACQKAAKQGNAEAQLELGFRYQKADGVKKDSYEAFKWFRKSAEQGNRDAQTALAAAYAGGIEISQNIDEAVIWFNRAIAQNQPQAQYALGTWYFKGDYVSKNLPRAIELFQKSASLGYAGSQFMLGCCYAYGIGIEKDASKAKALLKRAAEQGHVEAKKALSELGN